jgi:dynein light chain LC8-type
MNSSPRIPTTRLIILQFDERKGPTWHCIVGRNFGSFVTHETKHFIYFYLGHYAILLFKTQ